MTKQEKMHTPLLRYHGGKFRLASWITSHFPSHRCYVEPFGGAASVLLQKERSHGEVYNDLDGDIFNLFKVLRNPELAAELKSLVALTPYSRDEFNLAYEKTDSPVERARRTIVRSAMGFGSGAATFHPTGFRCEAKRQYNTSAHCWAKYPPVIDFVCNRLSGVNIENRPAEQCMLTHDGDQTLHYVDPPYVLGTRKLNSSRSVYQHEMTDDDHVSLIKCLKDLNGMVLLSGYDNEIYNDLLCDWNKVTKPSRISSGSGTGIRQECLWQSPNCIEKRTAA